MHCLLGIELTTNITTRSWLFSPEYSPIKSKDVTALFDGRDIISDGEALLVARADTKDIASLGYTIARSCTLPFSYVNNPV